MLLDMPDVWKPGDASEYEILACAQAGGPLVLVASERGHAVARSIGLKPSATVCPVRGLPWITTQRLDRVVRRLGITEFSCRSASALRLASGLYVISLSTPDRPEPLGFEPGERERLRAQLGLRDSDRLLVPLACHASQIDAMTLCMGAATLAIAELPTVTLLPARSASARRARAFLSGADRVLDVIATELPTLCFAPAADAMIWGPHADVDAQEADSKLAIDWARRFGVPVLCPSANLEFGDKADGSLLYACNGSGGADIASAMIAAFGSPAQ